MLRKLMKYEFSATGRLLLPLFASLLIISIVNRLLVSLRLNAPSAIGIAISVILIVGILVLTLILMIQRFRQNLLSNEGYLMMTLPTRVDNIILSKLFTATAWVLASFAVVTISILIMALTDFNFYDSFSSAVMFITDNTDLTSTQLVILAIETIVLFLIGSFSSIQLIYACISLSMLVNKHRGLFTLGAFIVITTVMQTISSILIAIASAIYMPDGFVQILSRIGVFGVSQLAALLLFLSEAILCVIYYVVTRYMLKNRLNLQ